MTVDPDELLTHEVDKGYGKTEKEPNWAKVRGTFMKFAREVDEIRSAEHETPKCDVAYNRWLKFMRDKTGGKIVVWVSGRTSADKVKEKMREFYKDNDEFRSLVKEKWTKVEKQDDDEEEEKEEVGKSQSIEEEASGQIGRTGLTDFAEENGTTDSIRKERSNRQERLGTGSHNTVTAHARVETLDESEIRNEILLGNVYEVLDRLPSNSVDSVVTSPPYYDVRDYDGADGAILGGDTTCDHTFLNEECKKCGAWKGQLGREPTPEKFVDHLVGIFMKIKRVLKPTGSLWINIDDKFLQSNTKDRVGAGKKSMAMVPERLFMRLISNGYLLRDKVMWVKQVIDQENNTQGMVNPHSAMDRFNRSWEPLYRFTLQQDYYFDLYPVMKQNVSELPDGKKMPGEDFEFLGNIPDSWRMNTGRTQEGHFAVFSEFLPQRPIQSTVPRYCCARCGEPYERDVERQNLEERDDSLRGKHDESRDEVPQQGWHSVIRDNGFEKQCKCDTDETKRGIVLEPFTGRGTTLKVAAENNRDFVGVEISEEYLDIAEDFVPSTKQASISEW